MAKESLKAKEVKRAKLVAKYSAKRAELKKIMKGDDYDAKKSRRHRVAEITPQLQPHPYAQSLQADRTSQRLHPSVRPLPYQLQGNGYGRFDPRC